MKWKVDNALNRDVERQQLNKILKDIEVTVTNIQAPVVAPKPPTPTPVPTPSPVTVTLVGDVTGTARGTGQLTIDTSLAVDVTGIEEAPMDGAVYWRGNQQWQPVPDALQSFSFIEGDGLLSIDEDGVITTRRIEGVNEQTTVTYNDEWDENEDDLTSTIVVGLDDVPNSGVAPSVLRRYTRDSKGRISGDQAATTTHLPEGDNLYFTEERAVDAVQLLLDEKLDYESLKTTLLPGANVTLTFDDVSETITITSAGGGGGGGGVEAVLPGEGIEVDSSDPTMPAVSLSLASQAALDLATSALQAGDNISELVNDAGYVNVDEAALAAPVQSVNNRIGDVVVPDFVAKATTPVASDYGRSLLNGDRWRNTSNGVMYTYQDGVWLFDNGTVAPVQSVNNKTGEVVLSASDVEAEPEILPGATGQFWRGDKVWTNSLMGSMSLYGDLPAHRMFSPNGSVGYRFLATVSDAVDFGLGIDRWNGSTWVGMYAFQQSAMFSVSDNAASSGVSFARWSVVYAATGTINTSDAREKTAPRDLTSAELACALDIARLPCIFQWLESIAEKGEENARLHAGPTVQAVIEIMETHRLEPFRYSFVCYDRWEEQKEIVQSWDEERDEEGNVTREAGSEVVQEYRPAGDRYSLRPSGLDAFCRRALVHQNDMILASLEELKARLNKESV